MAVVGFASAQVTSLNSGYDLGYAVLQSTGQTIDQVSFTVPNKVVTHPYGNFRPDAYVEVKIPVTNTTGRTVNCEVVSHHLSTTEADRARRIGSLVGMSSGILISPAATGTLRYFIQFNSANAWNTGDFGATANFDVKVVCRGVAPNLHTPLSH